MFSPKSILNFAAGSYLAQTWDVLDGWKLHTDFLIGVELRG
jgi:hypothetical protein